MEYEQKFISKIQKNKYELFNKETRIKNKITSLEISITNKRSEIGRETDIIKTSSYDIVNKGTYPLSRYAKIHVRHLIEDIAGIFVFMFLLLKYCEKSELAATLFLVRKFDESELGTALCSMICLILFLDFINNLVSVVMNILAKSNKNNDRYLSQKRVPPLKSSSFRYSVYAGFNLLNLILVLYVFLRLKSNIFPNAKTIIEAVNTTDSATFSVMVCSLFVLFFIGSLIHCLKEISNTHEKDKENKEKIIEMTEKKERLSNEIKSLEKELELQKAELKKLRRISNEEISQFKKQADELYSQAVSGENIDEGLMLQAAECENISACMYFAKKILFKYYGNKEYSLKEKEKAMKVALSYAEIGAKGNTDCLAIKLFIECYYDMDYEYADIEYYEENLAELRKMKNENSISDEKLRELLDVAIEEAVRKIDRKGIENKYRAKFATANNNSNNGDSWEEMGYNPRCIFENNDSSYMGFSSKSAYDTATDLFGMEVQNNMFGGGIDATGM